MPRHEPPENEEWSKLRSEMIKPLLDPEPKLKDNNNLLVPMGCLATIGALGTGLWSFRRGNSRLSQRMMQMRIIAQGFTVTALISGFLTARKTLK